MWGRHTIIAAIALVIGLAGFGLTAGELFSQAKVPTLSEVDALKLEQKLLQLENMRLRMQQTPEGRAAAQLEQELQEFAKTLEKEGYVLQRTEQGTWSYIPQVEETR